MAQTSPADLHKTFTVWLACIANYDVFSNLGDADYQAIAAKTGYTPERVAGLIASVRNADAAQAANGTTPLQTVSSMFNDFADDDGYDGGGGILCADLGETLAAMS